MYLCAAVTVFTIATPYFAATRISSLDPSMSAVTPTGWSSWRIFLLDEGPA